MMSNAAKNFDILAISLNVLHNYFDSSLKLFSNLVKFLDFSKIVLFVICKICLFEIVNKIDNIVNYLLSVAIKYRFKQNRF